MRRLVTGVAAAAMLMTAVPYEANAKGCITGGVAGGVAGHYAGHHGVLGALGGCVVGHHLAKRRAKNAELARQQELQRQQQMAHHDTVQNPYNSNQVPYQR